MQWTWNYKKGITSNSFLQAFSDFAPGLKPLYDGCATNREMWNKTPVWEKAALNGPPDSRRKSQAEIHK